jgi:hypothetical protein
MISLFPVNKVIGKICLSSLLEETKKEGEVKKKEYTSKIDMLRLVNNLFNKRNSHLTN